MTLTLGAIWLQLHGDPEWEPSSWTSIDNAATKDSSRFTHFFSHKYYIRVYLKVFGLPPPRHTHTPIRHVSLPVTSLVLFCSLSYTPTSTPLEVRKAGSSSSWVHCNFSHVTKFSETQVLLWKMMVRIWFLNFVSCVVGNPSPTLKEKLIWIRNIWKRYKWQSSNWSGRGCILE